MLINTIDVVLVAIAVGAISVTSATELYHVDTSVKGEAVRRREGESSSSSDKILVETSSNVIAASEDIFVRDGSGDSSGEIPVLFPPIIAESSENVVPVVPPVMSSSEEIGR